MEPISDDDLKKEIKWFWGNAGHDNLRPTLQKNMPRVLEAAELWANRLGGNRYGSQAVLSFVQQAVDTNLGSQAQGFRAIYGLGEYEGLTSKARQHKVEFGTYDNLQRRKVEFTAKLAAAVQRFVTSQGLTTARLPIASLFELPPVTVPRDDLEVALRLRLDTRGISVLWGEPGNGKTVLAYKAALAWANQPDHVLLIRTTPETESPVDMLGERDLLVCLQRLGEVPLPTLAGQLSQLRVALAKLTGRWVIILDDPSDDLATEVLNSGARIPITVTRRFPLDSMPIDDQLRVPEFTSTESLVLATRLLPDEAPGNLERLCQQLGHRPALLDSACQVIRSGQTTEQYLSLLSDSEHRLDQLASTLNWSPLLIDFYREISSYLAPGTAEGAMLDAILWLTPGSTSGSTLVELLQLRDLPEPEFFMMRDGLFDLVLLSLIDTVDGAISMNKVTRTILRALRYASVDQTLLRYANARFRDSERLRVRNFRTLDRNERYTDLEFWHAVHMRQYDVYHEIFGEPVVLSTSAPEAKPDVFAIVDPLPDIDCALLSQVGLRWFAPSDTVQQFALLSNLSGSSDEPRMLWANGQPPRPLTTDEERLYDAAFFIMATVGLPDAERRNPGYVGSGPLLDYSTCGHDDGQRHISIDIVNEGTSFEPEGELAIWAVCGRLGTWRTDASLPECAACTAALSDESRLLRLHRFCSALVTVAEVGAAEGHSVTLLLARYTAMGGRAAMLAGEYERSASLIGIAASILADISEQAGVELPAFIDARRKALIAEFEARSGHSLDFYVPEAWTVLNVKGAD